jgi:hypothetical protein
MKRITPRMKNVSRGTKCFGAYANNKNGYYFGRFPNGFLSWLKRQEWLYGDRCHLCSGMVEDDGAFRVDIRPETNPDLVADASNTELPDNRFDTVVLDPPYSRELAKNYGTEKYYKGINAFTKEAARITKQGGLIITLSYEIPKRIPGCEFIAVWGIYTVPSCSYMRCLTVSRKIT